MRFQVLRGLAALAMFVGALGVGMTAHAAGPVNMAKLCSNGAYVLYMDDNGDQFENEVACVAWTRQHPGKPPIAIDDDPDEHPDQPVDASTDTSGNQSGAAPTMATNSANVQSAGRTVLVVVTDPADDTTATDDDSDDSDG